jgi:hypothetical protein
MPKGHFLSLLLVTCFSLLLTGNPQTKDKPAAAADTTASSSAPPFVVCKGTFALCTEAVCDPVIATTADGKKEVGFSCRCKAQVGYSVGANLPGKDPGKDACESVPKDPPSVGQQIPSRYSPINSYVACNNNRPWAWCLDARCTVDHVDQSDPAKDTAKCACRIATGKPYVYVPSDGKYSKAGCDKEYVSSATTDDVFQVTEFLTTPAGKDLPPSLPTLLVPTPTPTPTPAH